VEDASGEFAAPYGLVRTHALRNSTHRVRIAMSVALLRRGEWAPRVPDPQHIAFGTDDIAAAAAHLQRSGAPLVPVPQNYYDDLDARLGLSPELLELLRGAGALYDRTADGEFLHLYTEVLGGRVFFEVVQRTGAYQGYGEVNAPVRMAAHRRQRLAQDEPTP
jgi:4-hydroxyphenylpyruvate dioxygenase